MPVIRTDRGDESRDVGIDYESIVDHPRDEVFSWHTRPGAMRRLIPPWQPMRVVAETESLADGRAILGLPGGLRWVAQHQAADFDPPRRFVDVLSSAGVLSSTGVRSLPPRAIGWWRHTHDFADGPITGTTRVHDRVDTTVPGAVLRSTFVYRHRQLAQDLAAHRDAAAVGTGPLTVAVTDASGLVGTALSALLSTGGHRVIRLVHSDPVSDGERRWDALAPAADLLAGVDAVVHLTAIADSSIEPTRKLAECAARSPAAPRAFVIASATGYYGVGRDDEPLTEDSARGQGSLAEMVARCEEASSPAAEAGLRVVTVRTGVVQAADGGTLKVMRRLFATGLGGRLGSGRQWLSWIGLDDLLDVYYRAVYDDRLVGPVNAVSPNPVRNVEYTRALGAVLHRPTLIPVPAFGASQRVLPARLAAVGHRFRQPEVTDVLAHQLGRG